jgi:cation-transporting P-type ATPase I
MAIQAPWPAQPGARLVGAARGVVGWLSGRTGREVWERPDRIHIETHGVHGPEGARVARRVERALGDHPGVRWARVNAPACRVVVGLADPPASRRELIALVGEAEAAPTTPEEEIAEEELHHPAESTRRIGLLPNLVVDGAALALAGITRVARWAPLPAELAGMVSAAELHPRAREFVAGRMHGAERAGSAMSMASGLAQGLASRGTSVVLDIAQRISQWQEAVADRGAWREAEPRLIRGPEHAGAEPVAVQRPSPLPDGPVERYQQRILTAGAAAVPLAAPLVGLRRAAAAGLACLPKATEAGRNAFASQLGAVLARRGVLVMDRSALRLLDRLDTLVIDGELVRWGRWTLTDVVPLAGADPAEVAERGFELYDPQTPQAIHGSDQWRLGPVDQLPLNGRTGARERNRLRQGGAELVLGLARGRRLLALFAVQAEPAPGLDAVVRAARQGGLRTVLATDQPRHPYANLADDVLHSDLGAFGAVRRLQAGGGVAMLVSDDRRALGAADCGLGVHRPGSPPPWGAQVLVGSDLAEAVLVVEAAAAARLVDRDAITLAKTSTALGAVNALAGSGSVAGRSLDAVNAGAALAFADGVWRAHHLRPPVPAAVGARAPWHLMPPAATLRQLDSDQSGLTEEQAAQRRRAGQPLAPLGTSLTTAFLEELANPLTPVLAGGAALSAVVGSLVDAGLVAGITGVSALAGAVQRVRTDRALADLLARSAVGARVRRDGTERAVTAEQLVPGDIVLLGPGDVVPADCRLLEANGVEADESSVTGESLPVIKDPAPVVAADLAERSSMLYEGTTLASGEATAVVVATGEETEVGRSMAAARQEAPVTGIEAHLGRLTRRSLPLALGSAAAVTGAGLLHGVRARDSLGTAVSLAVASVPEGLPFLVNGAQLAAARRLAELGTLVRNPRVIEALGRVDVLCFDKTGTLTEARLTVREVHDGRQGRPAGALREPDRAVVAAALRASPENDRPEDLAHQTDRAVVECAQAAGIDPAAGHPGWHKLRSLPFDPSRSYHATVGRAGADLVLSVKGGPEVVLARCTRRRTDGGDEPLTNQDHTELSEAAEVLAGSGHRVLAVAERRAAGTPQDLVAEEAPADGAVRDLVFLGFLALADPVRASAAPAVARLHEAGVRTVMLTGDHPATAEAIAATVQPGAKPRVVVGSELDELDDTGLDRRLDEVDVVARCTPAQKVRIISSYRRLGKVVAMTGDGANDAPAIRLAEVGIALGRRGTPAAQAAADLVVSDDRLETIIAALIEGRAMWSSVRQALGILLGGNLGEIAFTVLAAAATGRSPLNARQLLLVNLLTDLAPALAIAVRPPDETKPVDLLNGGPDAALGQDLTREMTIRATATLAGASGAWVAARLTGRSRRAATVALAALVGTQLGQTLLTGGLDRNVLLASVGSAAALTAVIQTPGVSHFFGCTPLGPVGWSIAAGSATAGTVLGGLLARAPAFPGLPPGPSALPTGAPALPTGAPALPTGPPDRPDRQSGTAAEVAVR